MVETEIGAQVDRLIYVSGKEEMERGKVGM